MISYPSDFTNDSFYILLKEWCLFATNQNNIDHGFLHVGRYSFKTNIEILGKNYIELCQKIIGIDKSGKKTAYDSMVKNNQLPDVRELLMRS